MDLQVLDEEKISGLVKYQPTKEELNQIQAYKGDPSCLATVEKFFLLLCKIPNITTRLASMYYCVTFDNQLKYIKNQLEPVEAAVKEVRDCKNVRTILAIVLKLGNFLNGGTRTGDASGFRLTCLEKLKSIKSVDGKTTLLHYLVYHLRKSCPEALKVRDELANVAAARRVESSLLSSEVRALDGGLNRIEKELDNLKKKVEDGETLTEAETHFEKSLAPFYARAFEKFGSFPKRVKNILNDADELAEYF